MTDLLARLDLGIAAWTFCLGAAFLGAFAQRLSGQAFGMIAAPLIALAAPGHLPAGLLVIGIAVGLTTTAVDRSAIRLAEVGPGFAGRALGAVLAAMIAARVASSDALALLIGLVVLLAVGLSLSGRRVPLTSGTLMAAGLTAGLMGTLTAIGAPPMALLYQHEETRRARAMQNLFFFWGMCVSVAALCWQDLVTVRHLLFALTLLPGVALGILAATPVARLTGRRAIRPLALGLSTLAALTLILRTLIG